jgi:hypothetical protein
MGHPAKPTRKGAQPSPYRCNHPLAVLIDPTDRELRELEQMLATCPVCSQWSPGDGPIMAVMSTLEIVNDRLERFG